MTTIDHPTKTLAPGETRYVPKPLGQGRTRAWQVYDRALGSFPVQRPVTGRVAQDHATEDSAKAECDRLEALR